MAPLRTDPPKTPAEYLTRHWGARIREVRRAQERSQVWVAHAVGVDQRTISRIERGDMTITPRMMIRLAAALDIEPAVLFTFPPGLLDAQRMKRKRKASV